MKRWPLVAAGIVIAVGVAGAIAYASRSGGPVAPGIDRPADEQGVTPDSVAAVAGASNHFAYDLYGKLRSEPGNIFFSPYSISNCLAMVFEGAAGSTANEMQDVFRFPEDALLRQSGFAALHNRLNLEDAEYELRVANGLWAQQGFSFLPSYMDTLSGRYAASAEQASFQQDPEGERARINDWVADRTAGKIPELFPPKSINPLTRLVLANAVYFKGKWVLPFDEARTQDGNFHLEDGGTAQVPMMSRGADDAGYAESGDAQILHLPYEGENLEMTIVLPKQGKTLAGVEAGLISGALDRTLNSNAHAEVAVTIPRCKVETSYTLNDTLEAMGMPTAFSDTADFSGMTGKRDLFISLVVHKAYVSVDEEGTEAAAATGAVMELTAAPADPPVIFRADHPFLFLIRYSPPKEQSLILFMGRVTDPGA